VGRDVRRNDRFRDLVDLLLMKEWIEDYSAVTGPCKEVFASRSTHQWPPLLIPDERWEQPYARLAKELELKAADLHQAVVEIRHLVTLIDETAPSWPSIAAPKGLTATTWYYAVRPDNSVVRVPFAIGDGLLRDRDRTIPNLKPDWLKYSGAIALIGVVIFLARSKAAFVERTAVNSIPVAAKARGVEVVYKPPTWESLAEDILHRARAPKRAMTGLAVFLSEHRGPLPAIVGPTFGASTQWMHKLWPELGRNDKPRLVWDLHGSTPVEFMPPRRPENSA